MATTVPPNSSPVVVPPTSSATPPPPLSNTTSPPPLIQPSANPPNASTPAVVPPTSSATPPPPPSSPPPLQAPNANPPNASTPATPSPPPTVPMTPPPSTPSPVPPQPPPPNADPPAASNPPPPPSQSSSPPVSSPPPPVPPTSSPPPPTSNPSTSPPPPSVSIPPPQSSSPPQSSPPPPALTPPSQRSPPPPALTPPSQSSPPPPALTPPSQSSPPPPALTPPSQSSPPPPTSIQPPQSSPSPPSATSPPPSAAPPQPPKNLTPPSASVPPPQSSPRPPALTPPNNSPPPEQLAPPPSNAPPTPGLTPPVPPVSQPLPSPSNSTPNASAPPPVMGLVPPPPLSVNNTIPSAPENSNSSIHRGLSTGSVVAISIAVGIIMLTAIGLLAFCFMRKRRRSIPGPSGVYVIPSLDSSPTSDSLFPKSQSTALLKGSGYSSDFVSVATEPGGLGNSRPLFSYEELFKATNGFSSQNLLGEGGFGTVYKGILPDGREVAVKQLKIGSGQGEKEFKAEVEIISRIHHRHLVSLVGYCICENRRLLIYDYVPNDTLHFHLHGEGRPVLEWAVRVKVAVGAARGLAYLHEDCTPRVIHRDIKSSNILLDHNYDAKVSDFGLAKLALDAMSHITTRVMGTFGYMAPEYASSGKLTEKSDVFSYGVVLLELITGRKPVDVSQPLGDESLVEWARPLLGDALDNQEFEGLTDPRLERNYIEGEMFLMIQVAAACVRHSAAKRPRMGQVVRAFDSLATADLTNGMRVGESEIFNSAQQDEEIRWFRRMAFGSQKYSTDFFSQGTNFGRDSVANNAVGAPPSTHFLNQGSNSSHDPEANNVVRARSTEFLNQGNNNNLSQDPEANNAVGT